MSQSDDDARDDKLHDLMEEGVNRAQELFPDMGRPEAFILMTVLNALGPMMEAQYTPEQKSIAKMGKNVGARQAEVRRNPIADVRSYNPKNDPNW